MSLSGVFACLALVAAPMQKAMSFIAPQVNIKLLNEAIKVTVYPLINFIGANFYCLERQPFSDLYLIASLPLSKCCIKSL